MTMLSGLQESMTEYLKGQGVLALSAWPKQDRQVQETPLAVVRVKEVEAVPAGFQNYLGEAFDEVTHRWQEAYGQRVTVKFGLDLYSPVKRGEEGCRSLLDQVAGSLQQGSPDGLSVEKWSMGETSFDTAGGMFRGRMQVVCRAMVMMQTDGEGTFQGFEVKGGVRA